MVDGIRCQTYTVSRLTRTNCGYKLIYIAKCSHTLHRTKALWISLIVNNSFLHQKFLSMIVPNLSSKLEFWKECIRIVRGTKNFVTIWTHHSLTFLTVACAHYHLLGLEHDAFFIQHKCHSKFDFMVYRKIGICSWKRHKCSVYSMDSGLVSEFGESNQGVELSQWAAVLMK